MSKKRYTVYLSPPLARKFDLVARQRLGAKSALVEEALRASLEPQQHQGIEDGLARRLDVLNRAVATVARDVAIATETLALFVRYFLTITPPLPQSEQEPARLLGKERFQVLLAQVGRRLAQDHRLVSEMLETIAANEPDLFATASEDTPLRNRSAPRTDQLANELKPNGTKSAPPSGGGHG